MGAAIFVAGPAGSGKTTFCHVLKDLYVEQKRKVFLVNLDPAQALEKLEFDIDIRNYISVADIMEEADFGPNGGLLAGMAAVSDNIDILDIPEDDDIILVFDCPGQIELYIHSESVKKITEYVRKIHTTMLIYILDSVHALDMHRFVAGALSATIAMAKFELPHINVFSKCDLVDSDAVEEFLCGLDTEDICEKLKGKTKRERSFNSALSTIISDNGLLGFHPLNYKDENTIESLLLQIDMCTQYTDMQDCKVND